MLKVKSGTFLIIGFFILFFTACTNNKSRIYIDNTTWSYSINENSNEYKPLKTLSFNYTKTNPLTPKYKGFVWLKNTFKLPTDFQNKDLALFLGISKIAQETYINGQKIGTSGTFPPNDFYNGEKSFSYPIPNKFLNFGGKENTIIIKLFVDSLGSIDRRSFIDSGSRVSAYTKNVNLANSVLPFAISIFLLFIAILYFFLYIIRPKDRSSLSFSLLTLFSSFFLTTVSYGEIPFDLSKIMSFLTYNKIFNGIVPYITMYFAESFIRDYLKYEEKIIVKFIRRFFLIATIITVITPRNMYSFHIVQIICYILSALQYVFSTIKIVQYFLKKDKNAFSLLLGFCPIVTTIILSLFLYFINIYEYTRILIILGWQLTIFFFLSRLLINYVSLFSKIEYLNSNLEKIIKKKTSELEKANKILKENNKQLEIENDKTIRELELAANVQENFYTLKNTDFKDWEIALYFEPLESVSGDLYDIYTSNGELNGVGIFDISGHGLSSGLVTMLVKNIIQQEIADGKNKKLTEILNNINERVIREKGNIENYLTGIIGRINKNEIEFVNAGHPEPIFVRNDGTAEFLKKEDSMQCGVIGIAEFPTHFASVKYTLQKGDFFVLYTDGVTDIQNEFGEYYEKRNFLQSVKKHYKEDVKTLVESLKNDMFEFAKNSEKKDDITIFVLKRK